MGHGACNEEDLRYGELAMLRNLVLGGGGPHGFRTMLLFGQSGTKVFRTCCFVVGREHDRAAATC
jgi:hypothetical protein